jgi:Fe-S cluster assembly protein SufD
MTSGTPTSAAIQLPFRQALLAACQAALGGPGKSDGHGGSALDWLSSLRRDALESAHVLTLPTRSDEDWRFTDLSALYRLAFTPAQPGAAALTVSAAAAGLHRVIPEAVSRLVFVDGLYAPSLSSPAETGAMGPVRLVPLRQALAADPEPLRAALAQVVPSDRDAFSAINTAYLDDGAWVHAGPEAKGEAVHVQFISTRSDTAVHPRVLITAERGSELLVIEEYLGAPAACYCVNALTEIAAAAGARVGHIRLQHEARSAFHIGTLGVRLERDADFQSYAIATGARLSRLNLDVRQNGDHASISLDGLALLNERQLADTHSFIDHAFAHGSSRQLHKAVLNDAAHAVFNGRILVRPHAQKTDSAQESRNLLLSEGARVDTKPQLEIFADDVKCAHGATIGQLESEELFYLRSRGLSESSARNLLTYGFAAQIIDRLPVPSLRARLREELLERTEMRAST